MPLITDFDISGLGRVGSIGTIPIHGLITVISDYGSKGQIMDPSDNDRVIRVGWIATADDGSDPAPETAVPCILEMFWIGFRVQAHIRSATPYDVNNILWGLYPGATGHVWVFG